MVWEHVVCATGVDVEPLAQKRHRHRRAFDVPAREAWAPRAGPDLEAVLAGRLPQREVARVTLARGDLAPRSGEQLCGAVARPPPLGGEGGGVVVPGAVHLVRTRLGDEKASQVDHTREWFGGVGGVIGREG